MRPHCDHYDHYDRVRAVLHGRLFCLIPRQAGPGHLGVDTDVMAAAVDAEDGDQ